MLSMCKALIYSISNKVGVEGRITTFSKPMKQLTKNEEKMPNEEKQNAVLHMNPNCSFRNILRHATRDKRNETAGTMVFYSLSVRD